MLIWQWLLKRTPMPLFWCWRQDVAELQLARHGAVLHTVSNALPCSPTMQRYISNAFYGLYALLNVSVAATVGTKPAHPFPPAPPPLLCAATAAECLPMLGRHL